MDAGEALADCRRKCLEHAARAAEPERLLCFRRCVFKLADARAFAAQTSLRCLDQLGAANAQP